MTEIIKQNGLSGGNDIPRVAYSLGMEGGIYKAGDLLQLNAVTRNLEKCTAVEGLIAIVPEDIEIQIAGSKMPVYVTGRFDLKELKGVEAFDSKDFLFKARELGIFFAD